MRIARLGKRFARASPHPAGQTGSGLVPTRQLIMLQAEGGPAARFSKGRIYANPRGNRVRDVSRPALRQQYRRVTKLARVSMFAPYRGMYRQQTTTNSPAAVPFRSCSISKRNASSRVGSCSGLIFQYSPSSLRVRHPPWRGEREGLFSENSDCRG